MDAHTDVTTVEMRRHLPGDISLGPSLPLYYRDENFIFLSLLAMCKYLGWVYFRGVPLKILV